MTVKQVEQATSDGGGGKASTIPAGHISPEWNWHDEANALLRAAIECSNDAVTITDTDLNEPGPRIEYVNAAFTAMTGYTLAEVRGRSPRFLQGPRTDRVVIDRLRDDLRDGRVFYGETINYRKDGGEYVVEWRITPMRDAAGRILKWVAIQRDVTERRHRETQRDQQLAVERAAREEAERVGRMKDEFLATLSHELRTPLNAILGWTQLLQRGRLSVDDAERAIDTIERNARTQAKLIEDLLDVSRIMSGHLRLDLAPTPVVPIVDAIVQSLRPMAEAKGVALRADCATPHTSILGDASRLQQVVWNIVNNAIKFTPAGGRVDVGCATVGAHVEITVADTGVGIDPAFLPFVFDRFRQADASTSRRHGGLGLGLSIVRQLAELHGGSAHAHSDGPGRGATIVVRLPIARPAVATTPVAPPAVPPLATDDSVALSGRRVLLVEDDDDARAFIARVLTDAGAAVDDAADALAALRRLDDRDAPAIDVLVSDIGMPGVDGYELIRRVRQRPADAGRTLPAIALTAFARAEDRRHALTAGYQAHLAKPIDAADLLAEVQAMCARTQ